MISPTNKSILRISGLMVLGVIVSYFLAAGWWWLWMYQGWIGPVPFLHWIIYSDGEASFDLTLNEMWMTVICILILARLAVARIQNKS